jgi:ribosomal protein L30E
MNKTVNLLAICRKAGKLVMGFDASKEAMLSGRASVVLLASDLSPGTGKEIRFFAARARLPVLSANASMDEIFRGTGKKAGVLTVCDDGLVDRFAELAGI